MYWDDFLSAQKREAGIIADALKWGLPNDFFDFKFPTVDFVIDTNSELIVISPYLPEADGLDSLQRTFLEIIKFLKKREKISKIKISVSKEILDRLDGLRLAEGDSKPGVEVAKINFVKNYNPHDGIIINNLYQSGDCVLASLQALWGIVFSLDYFQKISSYRPLNMVMAGLHFYPKGSKLPKTISVSISGNRISINVVEDLNSHTFSVVPSVETLNSSR